MCNVAIDTSPSVAAAGRLVQPFWALALEVHLWEWQKHAGIGQSEDIGHPTTRGLSNTVYPFRYVVA